MALLILAGCSAPESPETQIRNLLQEAERVVESRELLEARDLIADDYRDNAARSKQQLLRLLGGYLVRNRSIHLLVQVHEVELESAERARVTLYAAVAGRPFANISELVSLRAGLYRFDLELKLDEDQWRLFSARWHPATRKDFFES